jgi:hypothetical protein
MGCGHCADWLRAVLLSPQSNGNWCCGWPVCCGGCAAPRLWLERLSMLCSGALTRSVTIAIWRQTASRTQQLCPAPARNLLNRRLIPPLSSRVVFSVSLICPTLRSIASAAMKQPFGAKLARSFMRSTPWIAASHKKEEAAPENGRRGAEGRCLRMRAKVRILNARYSCSL